MRNYASVLMILLMRIFISRETDPLIRLLVQLELDDFTEDEQRRILNGEIVRVSADEMLARKNGTTSFK